MSEPIIAIPSKGRPEEVLTAQNLKGINLKKYLFLDTEKEKEKYLEYEGQNGVENIDYIWVTDVDGGIVKTRNFILEQFADGKEILMMDDDIQYFTKKVGNTAIKINDIDKLEELFRVGFNICHKNNTKLWGLYPVNNQFFMSHTIKSGFINGVFLGIIKSDLRFNENIKVKEDYEITCQHVRKFNKVVRLNMWSYQTDYQGNEGGCTTYRTSEMQKQAGQYIIDKYPYWASWNTKRDGHEIILNFKQKGC